MPGSRAAGHSDPDLFARLFAGALRFPGFWFRVSGFPAFLKSGLKCRATVSLVWPGLAFNEPALISSQFRSATLQNQNQHQHHSQNQK